MLTTRHRYSAVPRIVVVILVTSDVRDVTHTGILLAPDGNRHDAFFYIGREDEVISNVQTRNAAAAIRTVEPDCNHLVMVGFGRDGDAQTVARYLQRVDKLSTKPGNRAPGYFFGSVRECFPELTLFVTLLASGTAAGIRWSGLGPRTLLPWEFVAVPSGLNTLSSKPNLGW